MNDTVEKFEHAGFTVEIVRDDDGDNNPRTNGDSQVSRMICWHRRYKLGDEQPGESPWDYRRELAGEFDPTVLDSPDDDPALDVRIEEALATSLEVAPLYLYDHSGVSIATKPFSCPWDSGRVGFAFVTLAALADCDMIVPVPTAWTPELRARARQIIDQEVEEYDLYLRGEVYGYRVTKPRDPCVTCHHVDDPEEVDACYGFLGLDNVRAAAKDSVGAPT